MKVVLRAGAIAGVLTFLVASSAVAWPEDAMPQLSSTPGGTVSGQPWDVDISFTSGGRVLTVTTLYPAVIIREATSGRELTFPAVATSRAGFYHASVVFPSSGKWSYAIREGNGGITYPFSDVEIGAPPTVPAAPSSSAASPNLVPALAALLLVVAAGTMLLLSRRADAQSVSTK